MKHFCGNKIGRRRFLIGMVAIGGAAAASSAPSEGDSEKEQVTEALDDERRSRGYVNTEHVRAYYRSLRY